MKYAELRFDHFHDVDDHAFGGVVGAWSVTERTKNPASERGILLNEAVKGSSGKALKL